MQSTVSGVIDAPDELESTSEIQKLSFHRADRSLAELRRLKERGRLIIRPIWQRNFVWSRKQSSMLIESFLLDMPVPVIYLARNSENKFEVVDGQQRLSSVINFIDGDLELTGLEVKNDLNGCKFEHLPEHLQDKLTDSTINSIELTADTPRVAMRSMFERLNTNGTPLNAMEIRNCVYQGTLNELIIDLAGDQSFKDCVNKGGMERRMQDRELVLRFLAFYQLSYERARGGLKKFLDGMCENYENPNEQILKDYRTKFKDATRVALSVFGDTGFRLDPTKTSGFRASIFQVLMVSFANHDVGQLMRSRERIFEEYLDLVQTDPKWVEYVTNHTGDYTRIEYAFSAWKDRLKEAVKEEAPNDPQRCFSYALKKEMFEQNNFCEICDQHISHINDAAMDHHRHWWRGGRTVPENARLVHRYCNATRPN